MALSELKSKLNKLSTTDYFTGDYSNGFRLNFNGKNTDFRLDTTYPFEQAFGARTSPINFFDLNFKVNDGFKKNFKLGESQYKNVKGKNFTWPLDLKRVDYKGNNLSPISDFERKFPNMVGGLSSIMSYPESKLRKKFLYSTDQEAIKFGYKNRYEFKKENQIRLDSNSTKHPLILQSLMDVNRYGWAKNRLSNVGHTTDFVRGGITTHLGTALTDQVRLTKFLTSGDGLWWLGKQFVLQYLNPRKETQLYNPLHINASIIPFVNVSRFIDIKGLGGGVATSMGFAKDGKGLYERTDGYDDWGSDGGRGLENKLAQYTRDRFDKDPPLKPIKEAAAVGKKAIRKAAAKAIFSKLGDGISELAGKFRAESSPALTVNSQEHMPGTKDMKGKPLHRGTNLSSKGTSRVGASFNQEGTQGPDYNTLEYKNLDRGHAYENFGTLLTPRALQDNIDGLDTVTKKLQYAQTGWKNTNKIKAMGDASLPTYISTDDTDNKTLGVYKSGVNGHHGDKVSLLPYGDEQTSEDLVKFQFKDMVNKKFIVFRATVSGLTDTISPEWGSEKYIGRADSVHVYKGAERSLSFGFTIAPTTKQELFTIWEKLNYLAGLNYPKYTDNKMVAPWTEFTFGDMYKGVPGFIENLSYSIPDNAPYEIDGIYLPKVIEATMGFKYVGNNLQTMQGKHFDLPWFDYVDEKKLTTVKEDGAPNRDPDYDIELSRAGVRGISLPQPPRPTVAMDQVEHDLALDDIEMEVLELGGGG